MASVKVSWTASAALREQELVATGDQTSTTRSFTLDLAELTPEQRQAIVVYLGVDRVGFASIDMERASQFSETYKYSDYLDKHHTHPRFDAQPTVEQVIEWIVNEVAEANEAKAHKAKVEAAEKAEEERKAALYAKMRPQVEALIEAEDYDGLGKFAPKGLGDWAPRGKDSLRTMIREARQEIKAEREQTEKEIWITQHGSEHLQRGVERGHTCQRLYAIERAAIEAPGFTVDFNDDAEWKERSCPSTESLDLAAEAEALGLGSVTIVWLTKPASAEIPVHEYEMYEDWEEWAEREAIVIHKYLERYDLVLEV